MEEANEFDRMMQSVSETTFNHSPALESLPVRVRGCENVRVYGRSQCVKLCVITWCREFL